MSRTGRPLALLGALALLVSAFLPWAGNGRTGIDLGLLTLGERLVQPTVGLVLVLLAAVPAVAALVDDHGWPRGVTALASGALVVVWLAEGPDGSIASGVAAGMVATGLLLVAAAVATPARVAQARYPEQDGQRTDPAPVSVPAPVPVAVGGTAASPALPEVGSRVVPFTAVPTVEAWGPTRSACFEAAVAAITGLVIDPDHLGGGRSIAVRLEGVDDAHVLLALAERVTDLLRRGHVPVAADLFDTEDGRLTGYLQVATTDALGDVRVPVPAGADVTTDGTWRARATLS